MCGCSRKRGRGTLSNELDDDAKTRAAQGRRRQNGEGWDTGQDRPGGDLWATALVGRKQTERAPAVARQAEAHYRMSSTTTPKHVPLRADGGKMGKAGTQDRTDQVETSGQHPNSGARKMNVLP